MPGVCDTDTILYRGRVPKEIVIVGGGPVGVEFATICHALGAKVTLLDRGTRLMTDDGWRGLGPHGRALQGVGHHGLVRFDGRKGCHKRRWTRDRTLHRERSFSQTQYSSPPAASANTEDLGLEAAGIAVDSRGRIVVDGKFRTSVEGVYAAGDVLGPTLASIAMEQGRAAVCNAFGIPFEGTVDPSPVSAVYGMPEVSGAGLTEEQCRDKGLDYEVGRADLGLHSSRSDRRPWRAA